MGVEKRRIAGVAGLTRPRASWHAGLRIVSLDLPCIREVDGYGAAAETASATTSRRTAGPVRAIALAAPAWRASTGIACLPPGPEGGLTSGARHSPECSGKLLRRRRGRRGVLHHGSQRLPLLDHIGGEHFRRTLADVPGGVDGLRRDEERISCLQRGVRFPRNLQFEGPFQQVPELFAGMRVLADRRAWLEFGTDLHRFASRNAQIVPLQLNPLEAGLLRLQRAACPGTDERCCCAGYRHRESSSIHDRFPRPSSAGMLHALRVFRNPRTRESLEESESRICGAEHGVRRRRILSEPTFEDGGVDAPEVDRVLHIPVAIEGREI